MPQFADFLALRYDANRTRHAYYRQVRLLHEDGKCLRTASKIQGQTLQLFSALDKPARAHSLVSA
jgi:hypothetical protein